MSIKKVANIAGVSIATVSRYFNNPDKVGKDTQKKVQHAIDKLNYSPNASAQNLRRGKTGLIIAVVPKISSSLYEPITTQINALAIERGYKLLVQESGFNNLSLGYFKTMIRCKQSDGFIILSGLAPHDKQDIEESLPIVLACEPLSANQQHQLPCLAIDYFNAAVEATQHLLNNKHSNIAFIAQDYSSNSVLAQQRGYMQAMSEAPEQTSTFIAGPETHTLSVKEKLNNLIQSQPKPTAIYCADDETAIEVMHWVKKKGLQVPRDMSIIGFNNTRFSKLCDPPLTTVNNPLAAIGERAINILFDIIDSGSSDANTSAFNHEMIIRESTSMHHFTE